MNIQFELEVRTSHCGEQFTGKYYSNSAAAALYTYNKSQGAYSEDARWTIICRDLDKKLSSGIVWSRLL